MYPKLVKDYPAMFLPLNFHLTFCEDSEMQNLMKRHFYFEQPVYPDVDSQLIALQARADELFEYYNKLAYMRGLSEELNPLYNYDRTTEITEKTDGKTENAADNENKYYEYPMNTGTKKQVNMNNGKSTGTAKSDNTRVMKDHTYGNIGVQTLGDIVESTADKVYTLYLLKQRYIKAFDDLFMITL